MQQMDVLGIGYSCVDYTGMVPVYPAIDEKMQLLQLSRQGGGPTATAMATVGRLGGRAGYVGKVGGDDLGRFILEELEKDGVDTSACVTEPGAASAFSFVVVDRGTGKRTIFWTPPTAALHPEEVKRECVLAAKVLHIDNHFPEAALLAAAWANEAGIPVVMDAGTLREGSEELLERTDYLVASKLFARQFTGLRDPLKAAEAMLAGRRRLSAVTLGEKGLACATDEGVFSQKAFAVETLDTNGAGDVFHGAFSFGLSRGWGVKDILQFASAAAAIKCTVQGGRAGIPSLAAVREFLSRHGAGTDLLKERNL